MHISAKVQLPIIDKSRYFTSLLSISSSSAEIMMTSLQIMMTSFQIMKTSFHTVNDDIITYR